MHRSPQPRTGSTTKLLKGGMPSCSPFLGKKRRDIGAGIVEGGLSTYSSWLLYKPGISHAGVFAVADVDDIASSNGAVVPPGLSFRSARLITNPHRRNRSPDGTCSF